MTPVADIAGMLASLGFGFGVIVAAELWSPADMGRKPKEKVVSTRDEHLRHCGWKIYCRPRSGNDRWEWRHGPGSWFNVPVEEAVLLCPLVLGGWERTSIEDRGERVWIMRGGQGDAVLVLRQSDAIAQAARIMAKYAAMIEDHEQRQA